MSDRSLLAQELERLAECEGGVRGGSERAAETMRQAARMIRSDAILSRGGEPSRLQDRIAAWRDPDYMGEELDVDDALLLAADIETALANRGGEPTGEAEQDGDGQKIAFFWQSVSDHPRGKISFIEASEIVRASLRYADAQAGGEAPSVVGALSDLRAWVHEMTKKHGNAIGSDYEQGVNDHGFRFLGRLDAALATLQSGGSASPPVPTGIYVASRASTPDRPAMWRAYRDAGQPIISTWIDEAGEGETACNRELWARIEREVTSAAHLILYVEPQDFPLKGALVEVGMALAAGVPVSVVAPGVVLQEHTMRPLGSWSKHWLVRLVDTLDEAFARKPIPLAMTEQAAPASDTTGGEG